MLVVGSAVLNSDPRVVDVPTIFSDLKFRLKMGVTDVKVVNSENLTSQLKFVGFFM